MRLLDTFCKAGGATRGYQMAGFEVVGVDIEPQPHYCGDAFIQADALDVLSALVDGSCWHSQSGRHWRLEDFDAIHASPPCQWITHASIQWRKAGRTYPMLLEPTRELLRATMRPYVIEQPIGQVLHAPVLLNGAVFGLRVKRDRYFETNWRLDLVLVPKEERPAHFSRPFDARKGELFYPVGHFSGVAEGRAAMGIDWMSGAELVQAIPPAYTEFIGKQLLSYLSR